jgi:3-phenylpropionate/trans-cinnamate dioxygenase ferredoxin subunit
MTRIKVAETGDIKQNSGKEVTANGVKIALFRTTDTYYAIDALCRHQDGSLAPGAVQGEVVECPLHSWHYNIRTGQLLDYLDGVKLKTYKVSCEENGIYIEV